MSERLKQRGNIEASPDTLVNTSEAINRVLGGERGDCVRKRVKLGNNSVITVIDMSPSYSWTTARFETRVRNTKMKLDVSMRVQDGRSGADDPDRDFAMYDNKSGDTWEYLDELNKEDRPEWVQKFLDELTVACNELTTT